MTVKNPRRLLQPGVCTAEDVARLVELRTGTPCDRHRLHYLIEAGKVPRPIALLGRNRLWTRDQLASFLALPEETTP